MPVLFAIALKSLLVAAITLGLLRWMRARSAAERSMVAHAGLLALVLLAFAPLAMPRLTVAAPAIFAGREAATSTAIDTPVRVSPTATVLPRPTGPAPAVSTALPPVMVATALYAIPAAILLFVTLLAILRLVTLRARAEVLVDAHWLSALARAQRRMGFKHGTALLTSNDLNSPISWGVMRPVILLNDKAVEAAGEAEAIIAHELAHVARLDWMKLLLARIATALFWFNPLVWILAREAHQLREETADDAVLAANIEDTDYAELLVGVARHDCPGLLLGAHGVAPSRSSLGRRIARVLDRSTVRGPAARPFATGVIAGATIVAAPLAALTFIPPEQAATGTKRAASEAATSAFVASEPADLGSLIASGVSTSMSSAVAAVAPDESAVPVVLEANPQIQVDGAVAAALRDARRAGISVQRAGRSLSEAAIEARAEARAEARGRSLDQSRAAEMAELGITPQYLADMRAASSALRRAKGDDFASLKAIGATPAYVRDLAASGLGSLDADEITEARAVGVTGAYAQAMRSAGISIDIDDLVQLRAVGVSPDFVRRLRAAGYDVRDADRVVELWAVGAEGVGRAIPRPPTAPPRTYNPPPLPRKDDGGG